MRPGADPGRITECVPHAFLLPLRSRPSRKRRLVCGLYCFPRRQIGLQFTRSLYQLLQLTFDVRIADLLVLEHAVGINSEGLRNLVDSEQFRNRSRKTFIAV